MARKRFSLNELHTLGGGRVDTVFQSKLDEIMADIEARPEVAAKREISLVITVTPAEAVLGKVDTVAMSFEIRTKVPCLRSRDYAMEVTPTGLVFNDASPDNPHQGTLDDELKRQQDAD